MSETNPESNQPQVFNIDGENFTLEVVEHVDHDVAEFFHEHWKDHISSTDYAVHKSVSGMLNSVKEIKVIKNEKGEIVAMSSFDKGNKEDQSLGTSIIDPKYQRKGLATILTNDQIDTILEEDPEKEEIYVVAETTEGLHFILSFAKKIKDRVRLSIDYTEDTLAELTNDVIDKFEDEVENGFFTTLIDLVYEKKMTVKIPKELIEEALEELDVENLDDTLIEDLVYFLFKKNEFEANIALWKMEDKEEIRAKLKEMGIIIL